MKTIELFCGTKSFSKVAGARGYMTFTLDNEARFEADFTGDVRLWQPTQRESNPDILWASPPCQGFSVAAIGRNWERGGVPKTDSARLAMALAQRTIELIKEMKPRYWFIENPRAMLRKMPFMERFLERGGGVRHSIAYCQYGDTRQKPTDIFTNCLAWRPKPMCSPGSSCHEAAPRGAKTGTKGLKGAAERGRIPPDIFNEIFDTIEKL